jgi:ABC-type polysaccharide/polyol phosphate export permease
VTGPLVIAGGVPLLVWLALHAALAGIQVANSWRRVGRQVSPIGTGAGALVAVAGFGLGVGAGVATVLVGAAVAAGTAGLRLLLLPLVPLLVAVVALGLSLLTCALQVAYRDVKFVVESGLLVAFYASPVLYAPSALTPRLARLLELNPMYGVLALARTALLGQPYPGRALLVGAVESALLLAVGAVVFRRRSRDFADLA